MTKHGDERCTTRCGIWGADAEDSRPVPGESPTVTWASVNKAKKALAMGREDVAGAGEDSNHAKG